MTKNNKTRTLKPRTLKTGALKPRSLTKPRNTRTAKPTPALSIVVVYATFPDRAAALAVGRALVEARLAGCINVLPAMTSVFVWKGRTETADEAVLIAKLPTAGAAAAIAFIAEHHSYDTPAILALPITMGFLPYLEWLAAGVDVA
ncbi:MAG: divalent-cation tolerance protein CutA [Hyphomicrobium sp.]